MFLFLVILLYFLFSPVFSCPDGSVPRKPYCYIFNSTETGFAKAETICTEIGGHLVAIHDAFLNEFIGEYAADYFQHSSNFWIGANSLNSQNVWEWTDGSDLDFKDWKKGEPQNTSDLFCASESIDYKYWVAESCSTYKPFVCEILNESISTSTKKSITSTSMTTIPTTTSEITTPTSSPINYPLIVNCSSGWTYFKETNSSYCIVSHLSWQAGEEYCQTLDGHLSSIHSDEENELIRAAIHFYGIALWIGLHTVDNGTTWKWTDGSEVNYLKWSPGFPNISNGNCAVEGTYAGRDIFLNTRCSYAYDIVCKKAASILSTTAGITVPTALPINYPIIANCSSGWTYFKETNSSYCVGLFNFLSFCDGEKYCQNLSGHLASIHSDVENNLINSAICFYRYALWIGLHTIDNGKTYEWTDGSHADNLNWGQGYPNISEGECVTERSECRNNVTAFFGNYPCSYTWAFICKKTGAKGFF